jgi:hypothetical protein
MSVPWVAGSKTENTYLGFEFPARWTCPTRRILLRAPPESETPDKRK